MSGETGVDGGTQFEADIPPEFDGAGIRFELGLDVVGSADFGGGTVTVGLEEDIGFPDSYTVHLLPAGDASESYQPGDLLSENTTNAVFVSESARATPPARRMSRFQTGCRQRTPPATDC